MDGTIFRRPRSASRTAHVVHFTAAFYTWILGDRGPTPRPALEEFRLEVHANGNGHNLEPIIVSAEHHREEPTGG